MKMSISDENNFYICFKIEELLFGKRMSIEDIQQHLKTKENIYIATKDLYKYIYILLCNYKRIIRRDYWDSNPEFEGLDKYYWDSSYQRNFYSFEQKSKNSITFLLMSDTHIGNAQFFDCKLLNAIYDYAIGKGATRCFLLGDLFDGNKNASLLDQDELERQRIEQEKIQAERKAREEAKEKARLEKQKLKNSPESKKRRADRDAR